MSTTGPVIWMTRPVAVLVAVLVAVFVAVFVAVLVAVAIVGLASCVLCVSERSRRTRSRSSRE